MEACDVFLTSSIRTPTRSNLRLKLFCDESGNLCSTFCLCYTEKQLHQPLNMHKVLAYWIKDILGNSSIPAHSVATISLPFDFLVYQGGLAGSGVTGKGSSGVAGFKIITSYSSLNWLLGQRWQVRIAPHWKKGKAVQFSFVERESVRYRLTQPETIREHHPGGTTMATKSGSGMLVFQFRKMNGRGLQEWAAILNMW